MFMLYLLYTMDGSINDYTDGLLDKYEIKPRLLIQTFAVVKSV